VHRTIVVLAVASLALLGVLAAPAQAQFDSCALDGNYVLSAFLFAAGPGQVAGRLQFAPPGACAPGVEGTVAAHLSVFLAGTPTATPVVFAWSYAVDAGGTVDIGPGILRGTIGHLGAAIANTLLFTADPALPPPAIQLAGAAVRIDLATSQISSRRFKDDVRDLGDGSDDLRRLRAVTFRYKRAEPDGTRPRRYGLIAEEVAAVYPELVEQGANGLPVAVRYHELPALLLNEIQRQQRQLEAQAAQLAELKARLARLETGGAEAASR
jgi:hypothetical protein